MTFFHLGGILNYHNISSYLVVSLELLYSLSVVHRPHLVLQLSHLLPPCPGFLLKALIGVLQLLHLMTGIELCT